MKRSEWYKKEQRMLIESNFEIEVKDYIQNVLDRAVSLCGTVCGVPTEENRIRILDEREEDLVEQIYCNMANRGIISGEESDEGIEKSELNILAYHMRRITMEKIAHDIMQESLNM